MTGIKAECPHCQTEQFIPIQIISVNDTITITDSHIQCDKCNLHFQIELNFNIRRF